MNILRKIMYVFLLSTIIVSCSDDDKPIVTKTTVTLIQKGTTQAVEGEAKEFTYDVVLNKSFDTDITLHFNLEELAKHPNLLTIKNPVVISKNNTKGILKIIAPAKPDTENQLTKDTNFTIKLTSYKGIANTTISLVSSNTITIKAETSFTPLTKAQKELLAYYKKQGIDLTMWIGKIPVEVTVKTGGNGTIAPFDIKKTMTYEGITHITLSKNATKEKPLLVMSKNAFGLSEYLQYVFRHETIENKEYWNNKLIPAPTAVLKALGDEKVTKWKNKQYPFNVMVDDIEFKADKSIIFFRKNGAYSKGTDFLDPTSKKNLTAVNFEYEFPLWDELVTLSKGNKELTEAISQGGCIHPNWYIGGSGIDTDEWEEGNWIKPLGNYDNKKGEMNFAFTTDYNSSGSYDAITVKFTVPTKK